MGGGGRGRGKKVAVPFLTSANTRWKQPGELADNAQTQKLQEVVSLEAGHGGPVAHIYPSSQDQQISGSSGLSWTT